MEKQIGLEFNLAFNYLFINILYVYACSLFKQAYTLNRLVFSLLRADYSIARPCQVCRISNC